MGIYNCIHTDDDDNYYYCAVRDCPCHGPDYHDASRNINIDGPSGNNNIVHDDNG
jgi:hypothetical protein